jgi:hypothetical protein
MHSYYPLFQIKYNLELWLILILCDQPGEIPVISQKRCQDLIAGDCLLSYGSPKATARLRSYMINPESFWLSAKELLKLN